MAAPATGASSIQSASISPSTVPTEDANSKPTYSSKVGSAKGKLENTVAASAQRHPLTQKAWASGTNPVTQRPLNQTTQRNGTSSQTQASPTASSPALLKEGLSVKITLDSGAEYEGTYSTASESTYTLKMVTQKKQASGEMANGSAKPNREQASMSFQKKDVVDVLVTGSALPNRDARQQNGSSSFRTDTAISGNKSQGERILQRWVPDENIETDASLGVSKGLDGAEWDQFAVNERLFGVTTSYDENIYTTAIDKSHPEYNKRYAEADKKAREIERSTAFNSHVAEERIRDNLTVDDTGLDEEDKYSGVQRQEFPPLAPSGRPEKYMPPGRRTNPQQPIASGSGIHSDPAIISSSLARKPSPSADKEKENKTPSTSKLSVSPAVESDASAPSAPSATAKLEVKATPTSEVKVAPGNTSASASRTASPQTRPGAAPNATATVEQDVVTAFKGFAAQQRTQADKLRVNKAKADKADKLHELKKFAASFKLESPVPSDLVSIIAKDPAKQREIQEKARRNAEIAQQEKQERLAKAGSAEPVKTTSPNPDPKAAQRPAATSSQSSSSTSAVPNRQNQARTPNFPPQGPYTAQPSRGPGQVQPGAGQQRQPPGTLGQRLRSLEQNKSGPLPPVDFRNPPTGPAQLNLDQNFSRRSSGAANMMGAKLNPNSNEFRPSAPTFTPNTNRSTGSSPRSNSVVAPTPAGPAPSFTLQRRRPGQSQANSVPEYSIIEKVALIQLATGLEKKWASNAGFKPSFDTNPTWRQLLDPEPPGSSMLLDYVKLFENMAFADQTISSPPPSHVAPLAPHQHQLPFHLQNNVSQRQSPRQPPMHLHNNQHNHGPNTPFNPEDPLRMMNSHSTQSYQSPRLGAANMAFPSPMGQPAQLSYQQGMQYPMGPGGPQMNFNRSYSGSHQFMPQPATHMAGTVMLPGPPQNGFMGQGGMMQPGPPMMFPGGGQPHFVPQGSGPMPMPGTNGYPSPGRGATMMMNQGSQQGQSSYGMSPGMPYGQPVYAQQQPGQMPNMRYNQGQPFGTSPQMHQYGPPHRGGPNGGYNKNYQQPQHGPHSSVPQNQIPTGPQARVPEGVDEAK